MRFFASVSADMTGFVLETKECLGAHCALVSSLTGWFGFAVHSDGKKREVKRKEKRRKEIDPQKVLLYLFLFFLHAREPEKYFQLPSPSFIFFFFPLFSIRYD
jgi:hypothetical protein